jgi:hypothetical protein
MAKTTVQNILDMGFKKELFQKDTDALFETLIEEVIAEQAAILEGRIGSTLYASTTSPQKEYVQRAEKVMVAAELVQRRINIVLGNAVGAGQELDISSEKKQQKDYAGEAEDLIMKLTTYASNSGDVAFGVIMSSHFGDDDA